MREAASSWYNSTMSHDTQTESNSTCTVQLGARGRLVLPARARRELGLEQGSRMILTIEEPGVLKLTSARAAAESCLGLLRPLGEGRSLAEELIAERREAARRE